MKPLALALQFMTRLPLPALASDEADLSACIRWFPAAGLVVGICVAMAAWAGTQAELWAGALLALLAWVGITGALHLDGLGDIADAAGAAHGDPARISAVLADPHIGSFGVVSVALQLIAKLVLLHLALDSGELSARLLAPLLIIPALARIGPLVWALMLVPLHEGLGTLFRGGARWWVVVVWLAVLVPAAIAVAPALLIGLAAIPLWSWWLRARIGGISGDGHGAGIEISETAMLAAWVLIA